MTREDLKKLILKTLRETPELEALRVTFSPQPDVFLLPVATGTSKGGSLEGGSLELDTLEVQLESWYIPMDSHDDFSYLGPMLMMLVRHKTQLPVSRWDKNIILVIHSEADMIEPVTYSRGRLALRVGVAVEPLKER